MWHLARVHARRRGWDTPPPGGQAGGSVAVCSDVRELNAVCAGQGFAWAAISAGRAPLSPSDPQNTWIPAARRWRGVPLVPSANGRAIKLWVSGGQNLVGGGPPPDCPPGCAVVFLPWCACTHTFEPAASHLASPVVSSPLPLLWPLIWALQARPAPTHPRPCPAGTSSAAPASRTRAGGLPCSAVVARRPWAGQTQPRGVGTDGAELGARWFCAVLFTVVKSSMLNPV